MSKLPTTITIAQQTTNTLRVSAGIMRRFVLWDTACNFNDVIQKFKNLNWYIYSTAVML